MCFISAFTFLVHILAGTGSSVIGTKICKTNAVILKYKIIITKKKKKHNKIVLLAKYFFKYLRSHHF